VLCVVGVAEHAVRTDPQLLVITLTAGALWQPLETASDFPN